MFWVLLLHEVVQLKPCYRTLHKIIPIYVTAYFSSSNQQSMNQAMRYTIQHIPVLVKSQDKSDVKFVR